MSWDRVERLLGTDTLKHLAEKRVGVAGLGSGGGFVALSLAMSGVGHFVLIDDDTVENVNVVRHVAGLNDVGRPKVEAVADLIAQRNPDAEVKTFAGRIEDNEALLDDIDLLIVGVDGEGTKYKINEICLQKNLTAVYAGVYEKGEGGDIVTIYPYNGPCYACWAAELREGMTMPAPGEAEELDYGMINERGTLDAEPALWLHVVRVAAAQADFALKELLRDTDLYQPFPANTLIVANKAIEIIDGATTPPHSAVWVEIARDPDCLVCGPHFREQTGTDRMSLEELTGSTGIELGGGENGEQ